MVGAIFGLEEAKGGPGGACGKIDGDADRDTFPSIASS